MKLLLQKEDVLKLFGLNGEKFIGMYLQWFPVKASPELAGIVADLMCDGHLQGPKKWRIDFTSKDVSELKRFEDIIFKLFDIKGKIRPCNGNKYGKTFNMGINNALLARILYLIGVPAGCKVVSEYLIPSWILQDKECFRTFVRRVFSCEGCVSLEGKNSFVEISMYKSENLLDNGISFLNQLKEGMKNYFDIRTMNVFVSGNNVRKDGIKTIGLKLRIKNLQQLLRFRNEIGFECLTKENKLLEAINVKLT